MTEASTEEQYKRRYRQLKKWAGEALGGALSPDTFVDRVIAEKLPGWCPNTWRFNRAALRAGLRRDYGTSPGFDAVLMKLNVSAGPKKTQPKRTSSAKAKRLSDKDRELLCAKAFLSKSPNSAKLRDYLRSGTLAGLRPVEWPSARLDRLTTGPYRWRLTVNNAKYTKGGHRAHGPTRTLLWKDLSNAEVDTLVAWIGHARGPRYAKLLDTLSHLMCQVSASLFRRRKRKPALYSVRHEFSARAKAVYLAPGRDIDIGLATIAALMGHAVDDTATQHYARPDRSDRGVTFNVPDANPEEVVLVRRTLRNPIPTRENRPAMAL